jgi:glucose-6-phosphate isomerase
LSRGWKRPSVVEAAESLRETAAWRRLQWHSHEVRGLHLRELFEGDLGRGERMTAEAAGLYLDYSKHRVTDDTLQLLRRLAGERRLEEQVRAMFRGEPVNVSEGRPALHVALRMPRSRSLVVAGVDVVKEVHEELDRLTALAERVRSGEWVGATGRPISAVVNIGIGGSDLGPAMVYEALRAQSAPELTLRFVSNVDPADLTGAVADLDPAQTLFVVVSKTMTTLETIENASAARAWLEHTLGSEHLERHFVGVAANVEAGAKIGLPPENMLRLWDWVGGRTSLTSAVGFSLAVGLGPHAFRDLLGGFHAMDEHFSSAALGANLPAIAGLLAVWYRGFFGVETNAVFPYSHALRLLPAYLQQLWMESNGKSVKATGEPVDVDTGSVLWGAPGTNAQHAVFQLLHQGTVLAPADLVGFARAADGPQRQHDLLAANLFAQAEALAFGRTEDELREAGVPEATIPHRVMPGNRPTSVILAERLDPQTLGALVALYEHSVFTQAAIWGIDPFDQWGVELGKELAARIAPELASDWKRELFHDPSTNALVRRYRALRDGR